MVPWQVYPSACRSERICSLLPSWLYRVAGRFLQLCSECESTDSPISGGWTSQSPSSTEIQSVWSNSVAQEYRSQMQFGYLWLHRHLPVNFKVWAFGSWWENYQTQFGVLYPSPSHDSEVLCQISLEVGYQILFLINSRWFLIIIRSGMNNLPLNQQWRWYISW